MAAEETEGNSEESTNRRRRRRRRRRRGPSGSDGNNDSNKSQSGRGRRNKNWKDEGHPIVRLPPTGFIPNVASAVPRTQVNSSAARRRRLSRMEVQDLAAYLNKLPDAMVSSLYRGMGGQPGRIANKDRMIQLTVRAIAQGTRLGSLLRTIHQRERQALSILVQCGGIAHHEEFYQELTISLGGNEREWQKALTNLGERGIVAASETRGDDFFYIIPDPIIGHLVPQLKDDLTLPSFDHEDVRVANAQPFSPPLGFSLVTLASYIDQHPPRLTQRQEIFKVHKDELDEFFAQIWEPDGDLFSFHIEFLMVHGMVELKGDRLSINPSVIEEWLQLAPPDQRDLVFSALDKRFAHGEWVIRVIHEVGGDWVPERPLQALYRRWKRGEDWRSRLHSGEWRTARTNQRESFSFTPLVTAGLLEMGEWGQEKFYRLNPRGTRLLSPPEDEGFSQFYLTPSFEIMAPAGMAPILFFRIGEMAELTACDRANTYKITQVSIERALEKGWRRDDILEFLRDNSQIGLPENVEHTLRGWMGHYGDVEFHDVTLLTVHRSQIRRIEGLRKLKPYLLHRFVPGMYAVERSRLAEVSAILEEASFSPTSKVREYPGDPTSVDARRRLLSLVSDARSARSDLVAMAQAADTQPENLRPIPGSAKSERRVRRKRNEGPPRCNPKETKELCERAIGSMQNLQMIYVTRNDERKSITVQPERLAVTSGGVHVLVAKDLERMERLSYQLLQIERLAIVQRPAEQSS